MREDNRKKAVVYALLGGLFFALYGVSVKVATTSLPNPVIVFFRQLFSVLLLTPFCIQNKSLPITKNYRFHIARAVIGLTTVYCMVYAIRYLPTVDAVLLSYTRGLFMPLVALIWFRKTSPLSTWIGLIIGFAGVACILKPDSHIFDIAALIGVLSGLFGAIGSTIVRRLTRDDRPTTIMFYYLIFSVPLAAVPMMKAWTPISGTGWWTLLLLSVVSIAHQYFSTKAYANAKGPQVASLLYCSVIFAAAFDWILWGKTLDLFTIFGIAGITLGSSLALGAFRERVPSER